MTLLKFGSDREESGQNMAWHDHFQHSEIVTPWLCCLEIVFLSRSSWILSLIFLEPTDLKNKQKEPCGASVWVCGRLSSVSRSWA